MENWLKKRRESRLIRLAGFLLLVSALLLNFNNPAKAFNNDYNKASDGTLAAIEWNTLPSDFLSLTGGWLSGNLAIGTSSTSTYALNVNGTINATNFLGTLIGTVNAGNVSAGAFGSNTGGGDYTFLSNVGIGTTTPGAKLNINNNGLGLIGPSLTVNSGVSTDSALIELSRGGTGRLSGIQYQTADADNWFGGIYYNGGSAQNNFGIGTNYDIANQKFVITTGGNVGIGTTTPGTIASWTAVNSKILNLYDNTAGNAARLTAQGNGGATLELIDLGGDSNDKWLQFKADGGIGKFSSLQDNGAAYVKDGILTMDLNSGSVGIGTTAPAGPALDVEGSFYLSGGHGDVNGDGNVNSNDALLVAKHIVGETTLTHDQYARGDVDGDGILTFSDARDILKRFVMIYSSDEEMHTKGRNIISNAIDYDNYSNVRIGYPASSTENIENTTFDHKFTVLGRSSLNDASGVFNPGSNVSSSLTVAGPYGGGILMLDTAYGGMWLSDSGQTLNFASNGSSSGFGNGNYGQMVLKGGNVGIGITNPIYPLDVSGGSINLSASQSLRFGGVAKLYSSTVYTGLIGGSSGIKFYSTTWTDPAQMVIDSSGSVGIGITNPSYKLDVQSGQINASGGLCIAGDCKTAWSQVTGTSTVINGVSGPTFTFNTGTAGTNFAIATSSGTVTFNIPTASGSNRGLLSSADWTAFNNKISSRWSTSTAPNIYYAAGKVAIGTSTNPTTASLWVTPNGNTYSIDAGSGRIGNMADGTSNSDAVTYGQLMTQINNVVATTTSGLWTLSGSNLFASSTSWNVGIGTNNPAGYKLKVAGNVAITGSLETQTGADFAEEFETDRQLTYGTVVIMGDAGYKSVKPSTKAYDSQVVGVVSNNPSIIAGRVEGKNKAVIAMVGVVKVKASAINGQIKRGNLLVSSGIEGYAMKDGKGQSGTIIGKALEDLSGPAGEINVLVNLQ